MARERAILRRWNRKPETLALSTGFRPDLSVYSAKVPVYLTSTFVFPSAEAGEQYFRWAYGLDEMGPKDTQGLIYSRVNNPNGQIFEERMAMEEGAEAAATFASGMGAISTAVLALLEPGQTVIYTNPVYGGTDFFFQHIAPKYGIRCVPVDTGDLKALDQALKEHQDTLAMLYIETPANPTNRLTDISEAAALAKRHQIGARRVIVVVDNTFLGPIFQAPLTCGADLVLYSATKFIGGHSDLIAGLAVGSAADIGVIKGYRTILGNIADPFTCWLMTRSLETLKIRMTHQAESAKKVAEFLARHSKVTRVYYPGLLRRGDPQYRVFRKQCLSGGSLIAFDIKGGKKEAFKVLNNVTVCRLAVSLGGTETLIEHPKSMTHCEMDAGAQARAGITDSLIRLSVGVESPEDIKTDLDQALARI